MSVESLELVIEDHAYERYCQRVEPIPKHVLKYIVHDQMKKGYRRSRDYIQIAGVWWRYSVDENRLILHTCYGRSHMDLPAAIRWAKRFRDRIQLGESYAD